MLEGSHVDDLPAMTVREVAGDLDVDEETVCPLAKRRELPEFKVVDIDAWIVRQLPTTSAKKREKSKR